MSALAPPAIGTLTDRVQLRRRELTPDDAGGHSAVYLPLASVWGRVRSQSGRSGETADGRSVTISHAVALRFRSDIGPGDRIVYRGRNLDVLSASDLNGRRTWLSCLCAETAVVG